MVKGPYELFCDDLDEVIERWSKKPQDDRLMYSQMIGAVEILKHKLVEELIYQAQSTSESEDDDGYTNQP